MSPPDPLPQPSSRRKLVFLAVFLMLVALAVWMFLHVGTWLVREDSPAPAAAIVVLSGHTPVRSTEAGRLYARGLAPEVWLTHNPDPAGQFYRQLGVAYISDAQYDREVLVAEGVPDAAIRLLDPRVRNTEQELRLIAATMQARGLSRVLIVTSAPHTRRVHATWDRVAPPALSILVCATPDDPFDAAHWWRSTSGVLDVVHEVLGMLNVWSGFRVRPKE